MSYSLYKVVHLMGVFIILMAMGGAIVLGTANEEVRSRWKKLAMITHGSGLALALLGGFGLLARMGISGMWPGWVFVKVLIWLILGGAATLAECSPPRHRIFTTRAQRHKANCPRAGRPEPDSVAPSERGLTA